MSLASWLMEGLRSEGTTTKGDAMKSRQSKYYKTCGNCRRFRGQPREWYCALKGMPASVEPSDPAEFCSAYLAADEPSELVHGRIVK